MAGFVASGRVASGQLAAAARPPASSRVVKANAYGHGAVRVGAGARARRRGDAGLRRHRRGRVLREGRRHASPILVFGALSVSDLDGIFELRPDADHLDAVGARRRCEAAAARARASRLRCHLKIDTGMNRLGFRHDNLDRTLPAMLPAATCASRRVYTHFATADVPEHPLFGEQRDALRGGASRRWPALGIAPARRATPPTARRCCATSGCGSTSSGRACSSTASCRRRWPRRCRCDR